MTAATDLAAWLDGLEEAHKADEPFWERCGCLAGLGEIPSSSDCHQAGLCAMRQADRQRDADVLKLVAALRAVLALAEELDVYAADRIRAAVAEAHTEVSR